MAKKNIIIASILMCVAISAIAQEKKAYGVKYAENNNLRKELKKDVSNEISFGGLFSTSKEKEVKTGGAQIGFTRVYHKNPVFHWVVGGFGTADYADRYGLMTDLFVKGGIRMGKGLFFDLTPAVGVGQVPYYDLSKSMVVSNNYNEYYNSVWRMKIALQASLGVKVSESTSISAFAQYTWALTGTGDRQYREAEGWQHDPTKYAKGKLSLGVMMAFLVGGDHQISGDCCWNGDIHSGYSFGDNKGAVIGAEIFHAKRIAPYWMRVAGFGVEQVVKDSHESYNSVYGKLGAQYAPSGANSPVIFEAGVKAGVGEYKKSEEAATKEETYTLSGNTQTLGVMAKAYGSVNFHFGRNIVKVGIEGGGHTTFGTSFNDVAGSAVHIDGSTSKKWGVDAAVTLGYSLAF